MKRLPAIAWFSAMAVLLLSAPAGAQNRAAYEKMVADHARANQVPEALVHRVIVRESKYQPDLIGRGGTIGLMQIKLPTARGLGYKGDAEGLRDPDTNLAYGIKYLAGAWRAAEGDHDRAVRLYASGYYEVAKRQRLERARHPEPVLASAPPKVVEQPKDSPKDTAAVETAKPADVAAKPEQPAKPDESVKPQEAATEPAVAASPKPKPAAKPRSASNTRTASKPAFKPIDLIPSFLRPKAHPKPATKKLAEAKDRVPRPPAGVSSGANAAKPR